MLKLKKIALSNFRSHRDFSIADIPKFLIITGRNASGKSSIIDAIVWNWTGANQHTDTKGAGANCLILDGENRAVTETDVETATGIHNIKRSIPHMLSVDGSKGGVRRADELLSVLIAPLTQGKLFQTLNSQRIIEEMSDNERRKFLSEVAGVGARTDEQCIQDFSAWLPTIGVPVDSPNAVAAVALMVAAPKKDYQTFYGMRRDNNALVLALEPQVKDIPRPTGMEGATPEQIEQAIRRTHARITMNGLEERLSERAKESGKDGMAAVVQRPEIDKIKQKVANIRTILAVAQKNCTTWEQRVALYDGQKAQVLSAAKQCPVFTRQCPLSKEEISEAVASTDVYKDRDSRELKTEKRKLASAEEALALAEKELATAEQDDERYKDVWSGDSIQFEKVRVLEDIQAETKELEGRLRELEEFRLNARLFTVNEETRTRLTEARNKQEIIELLVSAFSPSGIPTMLLSEHLPRLEQLATQASRIITRGRYEITFSAVDGELDISVISQNRRRPIHTLSTSERIWVALVLQHVVNQLIGNRVLMIDEAATLDVEILEGLQDFLLAPELPYDNVIVCATTEQNDFLERIVQDVRRVRL